MRTTVNQIFKELQEIHNHHGPTKDGKFFRGSFVRAINEHAIRYPLTCSYYNRGGAGKRSNQIQIFIAIADRVYKEYKNLNDTESDTMQCVQDYVDIITSSRRWQRIGRVEGISNIEKFIDKSADEVTGHVVTILFTLFDHKNLCLLPMPGYDFNESRVPLCEPVTITDSDGTTIVEVPAGGEFACQLIQPVTIHNSDNSYKRSASSGEDVLIEDITVSLGDGDVSFPAAVDIDLSNYFPAVLLPSGTYTPKNSISGPFDLLWQGSNNMFTFSGGLTKILNPGVWDGSAFARIPHMGDFSLDFQFDFSAGGSNVMFGIDFYKASNDYVQLDFAIYRTGINVNIFENGLPVYSYPVGISDSTQYRIERVGNTIKYFIDGSEVRSTTLQNIGTLSMDCSFLDFGTVKNITVTV